VSARLRLLVSVVLLTWLAWRMDWAQLGQAFARLQLAPWLAAVGLYILTQVVSAVRWRQLARPLGFDGPLARFVRFYFVGMYFNLFLPTSVGGDVVRAWYLDGGSGRRLAAFLGVFVDRFSGLLVLLGLACLATAFCPAGVPPWVPASVWATGACAAAGLALMPLVARWTGRFERARGLLAGAQSYLARPRLLASTTALSVVVQAANVVVVWLVGRALGAPIPPGYYWVLVPMVTLLTLFPVSLNGMGVREGGMILFLGPLGVPEATAVSLAFLWFLVFTVASLCGAGVYLSGSLPRPRGAMHDGPIGGDPGQGRAGQRKAAA
jgi:glycosyltransferase 2 family protein